MRVLVVGAGISGLAAARGLIAAGHEVTVLEQAPGLRLGGGGRCALLGDAAHGMPPVTAQGTNQALEDVATLVDCLHTASDPAAAVGAYSSARRRRAALASAVASRSLAVSGPRALLQSEYLLRMTGAVPPRLATRGFGRLLRALSDRM